jgi:hypothetical protein
MQSLIVRRTAFFVGLMCFSCSLFAQDATTNARPQASKRDILLGFAQCLQMQSPGIQANPRSPLHVCGVTVINAGNEKATDSVIIEDTKMAKCSVNSTADESNPASFAYVHALAIALNRVTGVEQEENRPNGIWDLAWQTATEFITDKSEIALVANPKANNQYRSQDQLHIHLVRLLPDAKQEILHPTGGHRAPVSYIDSLQGDPDPVWAAAERNASDLASQLRLPSGLKSGLYGVAVVFDESKGKYAVAAVDDSPERDFTLPCPGSVWQP